VITCPSRACPMRTRRLYGRRVRQRVIRCQLINERCVCVYVRVDGSQVLLSFHDPKMRTMMHHALHCNPRHHGTLAAPQGPIGIS
jgi:hypothetical protein